MSTENKHLIGALDWYQEVSILKFLLVSDKHFAVFSKISFGQQGNAAKKYQLFGDICNRASYIESNYIEKKYRDRGNHDCIGQKNINTTVKLFGCYANVKRFTSPSLKYGAGCTM